MLSSYAESDIEKITRTKPVTVGDSEALRPGAWTQLVFQRIQYYTFNLDGLQLTRSTVRFSCNSA